VFNCILISPKFIAVHSEIQKRESWGREESEGISLGATEFVTVPIDVATGETRG